jgi:hypothetical protein
MKMEGTRQYRKKNSTVSEPTTRAEESPKAASSADLQRDAMNLDRRAWFRGIGPALGSGLVKILRTSNILREDLQQSLKKDAAASLNTEKKIPRN